MLKGRSSVNEPGGTLKKSNMPHSHGAGVRGRAQRDVSGHPAALGCLRPPRQDARQGTEVRRPPRPQERHAGHATRRRAC
jgi:hypothetical protein